MKQYLDFLQTILAQGVVKKNRTGVDTISTFALQMRFNLADGFPVVTTKKLVLRSVIHELLWFLQGDTNIAYLKQNNVKIWDAWADENGDLGPVYGAQWRRWKAADGSTIDQIQQLVDNLKNNPDSRRLIVNAWNVGEIDKMHLPPCHLLFQFYVVNNKLSCQLYQRSADAFLGVPFNIASYALLTHMLAQQCNMQVGEFIWSGGDCHIYVNHLAQVKEQLTRTPKMLPSLKFNRHPSSIFDYKFEDIEILNYQSYPFMPAEVAV